jgi:uncharacterized protein (DUF427 family)
MDGHQLSLHDEPRRVEVLVDGTRVASSTRAIVLEETGLPPRYYMPRDDVAQEYLAATPTETVCPFKGQASYWTVRTASGEHRDLAWGYEHPLDSVAAIAGRVCFYSEKSDTRIDGELQTPPQTPWSVSSSER